MRLQGEGGIPLGDVKEDPPVKRRHPVATAIAILELLATSEQASWGVREIARALALPPSSVFRVLTMLRDVRVLQRDGESGRYSITMNFFQIASRVASKMPVREAAGEYLRQLAEASGESVYLARYGAEHQRFMFVDHFPSKHPLRYELPLYEWMDLRVGAGGLGILAFLSPERVESILELPGPTKLTELTVTDRDRLRAELACFRAQGYVVSVGRRVAGVAGIAAPVIDTGGQVLGAVVLAMPESRIPEGGLNPLIEQVTCTAQAINAALAREHPGTSQWTVGRIGIRELEG